MYEKNIVFITLVTSLQQQMILHSHADIILAPLQLLSTKAAQPLKHILKVLDSGQLMNGWQAKADKRCKQNQIIFIEKVSKPDLCCMLPVSVCFILLNVFCLW